MTNRDFLDGLNNTDLADIIIEDGIFNMACVENNTDFNCPHPAGSTHCKKCVKEFLDKDFDEPNLEEPLI